MSHAPGNRLAVRAAPLHEDAAAAVVDYRPGDPAPSFARGRQHQELDGVAIGESQRVAQADAAQDLQLLGRVAAAHRPGRRQRRTARRPAPASASSPPAPSPTPNRPAAVRPGCIRSPALVRTPDPARCSGCRAPDGSPSCAPAAAMMSGSAMRGAPRPWPGRTRPIIGIGEGALSGRRFGRRLDRAVRGHQALRALAQAVAHVDDPIAAPHRRPGHA